MSEQIHPINAFSDNIKEIITHYSEAKGYPIEYFLTALLGAVSVSLGRAVTLNTGNYTAIGLVWYAIIGSRGITKSESQTDAFAPVMDAQFIHIRQYKIDCDELEDFKASNPKAKTNDIPQPRKFILSDITPESLSMTLADNPKGCGIVYDELSGFIGRFNRYNSGADEQMYLSLFNGDTILRTRVDGKGNAAIKRSFLSIGGTIQPTVMKKAFSDKSDNGFFDRWLLCFPSDIKKPYPSLSGIDPAVMGKYHIVITRIMDLKYDEYNLVEMKYSPETYKIINEYQRGLIDIQNATENEDERGILAKMEIYLHRFALILQVLKYADLSDFLDPALLLTVSESAAYGAVVLCKYFLEQAAKMRIINPVEYLKDNWKSIYEALPEHGKTFDRSHFVKVCLKFGIKQRRADIFLKDSADRSETKLFFKVSHGLYTKNLF